MDLFAIDDSKQSKPTRDGMGPLVAVGGVHIAGDQVRDLELALDSLCNRTGFPDGEEFKWSPDKKSWEYSNLKFSARDEFNLAALKIAEEAGATGIVVMEDISKRQADAKAPSHEADVTRMFLERAQSHLGPATHAIVISDRPAAGARPRQNSSPPPWPRCARRHLLLQARQARACRLHRLQALAPASARGRRYVVRDEFCRRRR